MSATPANRPTPPPSGEPAGLVFDDPLDRPAADETDRAWGDRPSGDAAADLARFLDEKPPHHL
ncbi:hypothetical protein ABZ832_20770 [Streptantibioticus parmotrematis]|uniref:hypothetical protein n=1 Tax=Streptantibioticus parmotrematis TaxID=2873249 RepID=UPI003407DDAD